MSSSRNGPLCESVIIFADIAGSTRLYEVLGNERATQAVTSVVQWLAQFITDEGGRVVKTLGDGVLACFSGPTEQAVRACTLLMRRHQQHLQEWPPEMRLEVRVGIAAGDIVEVDGDCYGDAVNLAARLCDRAKPGEIWMTVHTVEALERETQATGLVDGRFVRLGSLAIRGKSEPIVVYGLEWRQDEDPGAQTILSNLPSTLGDVPMDMGGNLRLHMQWAGTHHIYQAPDMPLLLGRAPLSQVFIHDPRVSREHARIHWSGSAFVLTDVSRFGTWVRFEGGEPVLLRRDSCLLHGSGQMALGVAFTDATAPLLAFQICEGR